MRTPQLPGDVTACAEEWDHARRAWNTLTGLEPEKIAPPLALASSTSSAEDYDPYSDTRP